MDSLRGIITADIENYIHNTLENHETNHMLQMMQSVDYTAFACLKSVVNKVVETYATHVGNILDHYSASDEDKIEAANQIRRAATVAGLCGWFMEHTARNKLDLENAPSLTNYIDICINSEGKMERLKKLVDGPINKKSSNKQSKIDNIHKTYMDLIESIEMDKT